VGVLLLIPTEGRLNRAACIFGSVASFSQCWWRDDVDESRVGGLKVPVKTLVLGLGQKCLCSRYLMRNPFMRPRT